MEKQKIKVLIIGSLKASFIKSDYLILKKHYDVYSTDSFLEFSFVSQNIKILFRIIKLIHHSDVVISWFSDYHAFLSSILCKIYNKKSIVILGGYDVRGLKDNKGYINKILNYIRFYLPITQSSLVLPVEKTLGDEAKKHCNVFKDNFVVLPTGFDSNIFTPSSNKADTIITLCYGNYWERLKIKGVDTFLETAALLPEYHFKIIGVFGEAKDKLDIIKTKNVEIIAPMDHLLIPEFLQKAKVYCQLSRNEGFPNSLCEAMLCCCVPIGTDIPGIRLAIGDTGFIVDMEDPKNTAIAIKKAMECNYSVGENARSRIINNFSIEKRERDFVTILDNLY